ncbi:MAG: hypothetical protein B6V02_02780 [Thermoprotei archaeon ex4572_64]|nr:MAG: hypothetical protein B6V02_02780 [Thermoprotei archaeon ex4572_64]
MSSHCLKIAWDFIEAKGHRNIKATHRSTVEITKDNYVTERGDCIIACSASKALSDLNSELKSIIKRDDALVIIVIKVGDVTDYIIGKGSSKLTLSSDRKIIIRRSSYIDDATLTIRANKAAKDINRELIDKLVRGEEIKVWILGMYV